MMAEMPVRIPRAVDWALGVVERRPLTALAAVLALVSLIVYAWLPHWPVAAVAFFLAVAGTASAYRTVLDAVEAERDAALTEAASWRRKFSMVQAGEASAKTTELRQIGDCGEPT